MAAQLRGTAGGRSQAESVNNGKTVTEDPPAKKIRKCHRVKKEPVAEGKASNDRTEDKQESLKSLLLKGTALVDPECTASVGKAHLYCEGNGVYDVMPNQTYLQFNSEY